MPDAAAWGVELSAELATGNFEDFSGINKKPYWVPGRKWLDLVYVRHRLPLEDPVLRFSAAEETMPAP